MMTISTWLALVVVVLTVVALVKRYESRLVLLCAGFLMAFISLKPMMAFQQFDKSMTNGGLIVAICSAIGFAAVISYTKCDVHLVTLLTRPLKKFTAGHSTITTVAMMMSIRKKISKILLNKDRFLCGTHYCLPCRLL